MSSPMILRTIACTLLLLPPARAQEAPAASAPVLLRYRFEPGETMRYRYTMKSRRSQNVGPSMESSQETVLSQKTLGIDSAGNTTLEMVYESLVFEGRLGPGASFRFDSSSPGSGSAADAQQMVLRSLVGRPFRATIDPRGEVTSVIGFDEVIRGITADLPENPYNEQIVAMLRQNMGDEAIRQSLSRAFRSFPAEPLAPGAAWTSTDTSQVALVGRFLSSNEHRLAGREDVSGKPCVLVETRGTTALEPDSGEGFAGMMLQYTLESGTVAGRMWFSPEKGAVLKSSTHTETRMRIKFPQRAGEGGRPSGADYMPREIVETSTVDFGTEWLSPGAESDLGTPEKK